MSTPPPAQRSMTSQGFTFDSGMLISLELRKQRAWEVLESTIEDYPCWSVVARVLLTANPSVYTPVRELIAHCGRKKEMIQPHALV